MPQGLQSGLSSAAFVSDVHLDAGESATAERWSRFVDTVAQARPQALFVLGDLFEYWAGDDDLADPFNARIAEQLKSLGARGIATYFMAGNRDFLIGADFARAAGLSILTDPARIEVGGRTALISHGDAWCTDDAPYQAFRLQVRAPDWQKAFLARSLAERHAAIGAMRDASESAKRNKAANIMDVNADAVARTMRDSRVDLLIHGHTHRPARHLLRLEGRDSERWVLSDWDARASPPRGAGLLWDAHGVRALTPP